jgi:hypothetical protein
MKPELLGLLLISWLAPIRAQSLFDGVWKIDLTESEPPARSYFYLHETADIVALPLTPRSILRRTAKTRRFLRVPIRVLRRS